MVSDDPGEVGGVRSGSLLGCIKDSQPDPEEAWSREVTQIYTFIRPLCLARGKGVKGTQKLDADGKEAVHWSQGRAVTPVPGNGQKVNSGLKVGQMCQVAGSKDYPRFLA